MNKTGWGEGDSGVVRIGSNVCAHHVFLIFSILDRAHEIETSTKHHRSPYVPIVCTPCLHFFNTKYRKAKSERVIIFGVETRVVVGGSMGMFSDWDVQKKNTTERKGEHLLCFLANFHLEKRRRGRSKC